MNAPSPDDWRPYNAESFVESEVDLQLKDGRVLLHYWRHADAFHYLGEADAPEKVAQDLVVATRPSVVAVDVGREDDGPACRLCGCTQHRACPGGCSWVEADLCSACAPRAAAIDQARFTWQDVCDLLHGPGREAPSEGDLVDQGRHFDDWEAGFNKALEILERRARTLLESQLELAAHATGEVKGRKPFPFFDLTATQREILLANWERYLVLEAALLTGLAGPYVGTNPFGAAARDAAWLVLSELLWRDSLASGTRQDKATAIVDAQVDLRS